MIGFSLKCQIFLRLHGQFWKKEYLASALIHDEYKTNILNPKNNQEAKEIFSESQNQERVERFISEQFHL